jgi:small-conductance mechanosensitive channel
MKLTPEERTNLYLKISKVVGYESDVNEITQTVLNIIDTILEERNELIKGSLKKYFEEHNHDEICLNGALEALHLPILK